MRVSINMGEVLNPLAFHHGRSLWLEYKQEYRTKTREIVRDSHSARGRTTGTQLSSVHQCDRNTQGHGPLWTDYHLNV